MSDVDWQKIIYLYNLGTHKIYIRIEEDVYLIANQSKETTNGREKEEGRQAGDVKQG
jgi:hypothetical protein